MPDYSNVNDSFSQLMNLAEKLNPSFRSTLVDMSDSDIEDALRDYIKANDINTKELKELNDLIKQWKKDKAEENEKLLAEQRWEREKFINNINNEFIRSGATIITRWKAAREESDEKLKKEFTMDLLSAMSDLTKKLEGQIDSIVNTILSHEEKWLYSLRGLGDPRTNYNRIFQDINNISGGYVKQADFYQNLSTFLENGVVQGVEQRAYLQTLSNDFGMQFNAATTTLNRLIKIQNEDLSANRMAIEYSLKEFLNQNYKTSEYIKEGFTQVSDALFESQALLSAKVAAQYEATVQTWLGAYSSVGVGQNTITSLANAINAVGSGDVDSVGAGISNLVLMGAARAGLDYGEILTRGFQGNDINNLMTGITTYLAEMGANSSNVVRNQLSKVFGVNITDLMAIANSGGINVSGGANTDANAMFSSMENIIPATVKMINRLENFNFGWGSRIAGNTAGLFVYELNKRMIEPLGELVSDVGTALSGLGWIGEGAGAGLNLAGLAMQNANLLPLMLSAVTSFGGGILNNLGNIGGGLAGVYEGLGSRFGDQVKITSSDTGSSGSMIIDTGLGNGLLSSNAINSANSDLSNLGINIEGAEEDTQVDHLGNIDSNVVSIYSILGEINNKLNDMGQYGGMYVRTGEYYV